MECRSLAALECRTKHETKLENNYLIFSFSSPKTIILHSVILPCSILAADLLCRYGTYQFGIEESRRGRGAQQRQAKALTRYSFTITFLFSTPSSSILREGGCDSLSGLALAVSLCRALATTKKRKRRYFLWSVLLPFKRFQSRIHVTENQPL